MSDESRIPDNSHGAAAASLNNADLSSRYETETHIEMIWYSHGEYQHHWSPSCTFLRTCFRVAWMQMLELKQAIKTCAEIPISALSGLKTQ